jgi:Holliday junction DNA helicase RuvA
VISQLRGKLVGYDKDAMIIEVGGVGFQVWASAGARSLASAVGDEVRVFTTLIVREDALSLYGFESVDERDLFLVLCDVKGIGPKTALSILSSLSFDTIVGAVSSGDVATLVSAPGVGKRTAERLAMELRDKVGRFGTSPAFAQRPAASAPGSPESDAVSGLVALGYSAIEAERAVRAAAAAGYAGNAAVIIKAALARLGRAE